MFAIVEFVDTEEVAVVPKNWIQNNQCPWPSKQPTTFPKDVERCKPPGKAWPLYNVKVFKEFITYAGARAKLPDAVDMSDLSDTGKTPSKRVSKRRIERKETSSSDEEDQALVTTPATASVQLVTPALPPVPIFVPSPVSRGPLVMEGVAQHFNFDEIPEDMRDSVNESHVDRWTQTEKTQDESHSGEDKEFQKLVLSTLALLKKDVDTILVLLSTQKLVEPKTVETNQSAVFPELPCTSVESIQNLEAELAASTDLKTNLINVLSLTGGRNVKEGFVRMIEKVMTDQVGSQYSLKGMKGKLAFNSMIALNDCMLCAARRMMKIPITEALRDENLSSILVNIGDKVKKGLKRNSLGERVGCSHTVGETDVDNTII